MLEYTEMSAIGKSRLTRSVKNKEGNLAKVLPINGWPTYVGEFAYASEADPPDWTSCCTLLCHA